MAIFLRSIDRRLDLNTMQSILIKHHNHSMLHHHNCEVVVLASSNSVSRWLAVDRAYSGAYARAPISYDVARADMFAFRIPIHHYVVVVGSPRFCMVSQWIVHSC